MQAVIEATKAAIMAVSEDNLVINASLVHVAPRSGGSALKQHTLE